MAKINHIEMGAEVMALDNIEVKKGFMGWGIKLIYKPTHSVVKIKEKEFSVEDGRRLESILATEPENLEEAIRKFPVSAIAMGNVKLQACLSEDFQFAAVQLLSFQDFDYKPVTDVHIYEGDAAKAVTRLF